MLTATLARDPLAQWARHFSGLPTTADATIMLDIALEYSAAGCTELALGALAQAEQLLPAAAIGQVNVGLLIGYHRAKVFRDVGRTRRGPRPKERRRPSPSSACRPGWTTSTRSCPRCSTAPTIRSLGHWYCDRGCHRVVAIST